MATANNLLTEIQHVVGCPYLSDLHAKYWSLSKQMQTLIMEIPLERYSLSDWNYAVSYITGENHCYTSAEEARRSMIILRIMTD